MTAVDTLRRAASSLRREDRWITRTDYDAALADWLESTANDVENVHDPVWNLTSTTVARAVRVAEAILGGGSDE